jgi:excisionase family DNA binding protein
LVEAIRALAYGYAVTTAPQNTTLTTQLAADLLGVSRPTLTKLLDEGKIPHSRPDSHRRIKLADLLRVPTWT